ncbi:MULTISPECIES: type IV conjugative transfer system protein TraL [Chromatiaceae]|jgi:conjugal transfer pilus assembly protein TraL|uniref:Type IV conjugative transfer system protein TraL n=3 Tax=Thiocapsa TaxID=1056 RepID=F9UC26_9GAMM|nr:MULTISPECIES: type IV conjugative transfer system protein TraL [Thiocapsa]EGV18494.1 type IV conjugative transfer system protein TraL [Thiocapsa marina 5811]RKT45509.1 conjugal transfer pilus assembly protein TraL [Thiocapsa rosea]SDX02286.1 conjugal transfer pilus assembly protein TraL [Thiocapsa roseopersicina]
METLDFPHHIDEPPTLLLWRMDDLMPLVLALVAGILAGQLTIALLLGALLSHGYRRFRDRQADGYALHLIYWFGLMPLGARSTPNPFARHYVP